MKELRTTLDGRHWTLDDSSRAASRSQPPAGDTDRTSSKSRANVSTATKSHIPSTHASAVTESHIPSIHERAPSRSRATVSPTSITPRVLFQSSAPSPSSSNDPYSSDDGVSPPEATSFADLNSDDDDGNTVILARPEADNDDLNRSFVDDFLPPGFTGSGLLSGSSAILNTAATAVRGATVTAVRQMFSAEHRSQRSTDARVLPDDPNSNDHEQSKDQSFVRDRLPPKEQGPTFEQFAVMQRKYAALKQQMDDILSRQSIEQRNRDIENAIELQLKEAYEKAGMAYTPRSAPVSGPVAPPPTPSVTSHGPRPHEYRISHKSIGYLRPADASHKPFEAIDGEVYVRPLAWLAHLRTKLELRDDDFQYKNQVLQVASECLVGRAAAWWTAIGQRMRNSLLIDYNLELWHQHMQVLCQSKEQTRKEALGRTWRVDQEECWDYVWDKAALFEELELRDRPVGVALITEILDGLPASLARMCRTEFSPNPTVADLTRKLQVLVPRWRKDTGPGRMVALVGLPPLPPDPGMHPCLTGLQPPACTTDLRSRIRMIRPKLVLNLILKPNNPLGATLSRTAG